MIAFSQTADYGRCEERVQCGGHMRAWVEGVCSQMEGVCLVLYLG